MPDEVPKLEFDGDVLEDAEPEKPASLLLQDEDLLVLEFANNDGEGGPTASAIRHLELLVRKLLQLPSRPAVVLLNS